MSGQELWAGQPSDAERKARMIGMGLHVFYPEWQGKGRKLSSTFRDVTLRLLGSDETLTFPCQQCTKVDDLRQALSTALMVDPLNIDFLAKQGSYTRKLLGNHEARNVMTVKGIRSFKVAAHQWPHPIGVIGSGYHGLKTLMIWAKSGHKDLVCFDRNDRVGGYCWITAANKTSKLQTEFGAFHVWWGQEVMQGTCMYPTEYWETWPKKAKILEHFHHAAEEYGILPHIKFKTNVAAIDVVGEKNMESRYYNLQVQSLSGGYDETVSASVLYNYPGSMTKNRIVEYPGEDTFEGHISYGMGDDTPYDALKDSTIAILGNGAFAVENARTCVEHGAEKVYIVTRRKNLASPRMPCWFVHQGPVPTPGAQVLKMFEPMYNLVNWDPWAFYAVTASGDRQKVQITQASRFGIGDVTFLAIACGKLEYVVDTLKRCTKHTLHLDGGQKLEGVTIILKALGLLGDFEVDRMHKMTYVHGCFCEGDWRRTIFLDATGMNAANFTTFSTGIGTTGFVRTTKYLFDHPREWYKVEHTAWEQLPRNKAKEKEDKPAYVYDVMHTNTTFVVLGSLVPRSNDLGVTDSEYKHRMYHVSHPLDRTLQECKDSWDEYQATWKAAGCKAEYVPYPYTREMIEGYFDDYNQKFGPVGVTISPNGPGPAAGEGTVAVVREAAIGDVPEWASTKENIKAAELATKQGGLAWWKEFGGKMVTGPDDQMRPSGAH